MVIENAFSPRLEAYPPVPEAGLAEILSSWAGRGSLWNALATPLDVDDTRSWTARAIEKRAHRVLFERVAPLLFHWPSRLNVWIDILPAARSHARVVRDKPFSGVSWPTSRARFGWPPAAFIGRDAERLADMLLVTALRWTLERLLTIRQDAIQLFPDVDSLVRVQLEAAAALMNIDPVASASPLEPGNPELLALRREGAPWGAVADVAMELKTLDRLTNVLATQLLMPDEAIRWRLFHLAVLGTMLCALREAGCKITSLRPLSAGINGPAYSVCDATGRQWEIWFEASGVWRYHNAFSPYIEATKGFPTRDSPLGADLLLLSGETALIFECKYSDNRDTVARGGYYQAVTYAAELRSRLCEKVTSVAIGPEGVVQFASFTESVAGRIGTSPPSGIASIIRAVLAES